MILDIYPLVLYFFLFAAGAVFIFTAARRSRNYLEKPAGERKFCPAEKREDIQKLKKNYKCRKKLQSIARQLTLKLNYNSIY
jgi:hypothetical protein